MAEAHRIDGMRMLHRWSPNTAMPSFASIGVSGGWST